MGKNRDHSKFPNAITVLDNGNVGIGIISPLSKLHIKQSSGGYTAGILVESNLNASELYIHYSSSLDAFAIGATYETGGAYKPIAIFTSDTERMRIDADGTIRLKFASDRGIRMKGATSSYAEIAAYQVFTENIRELRLTGSTLQFYSGNGSNSTGSERMRISESGYVGIANTNPNYNLTVDAVATDAISWRNRGTEVGRLGIEADTSNGWFALFNSGVTKVQLTAGPGNSWVASNGGYFGIGTNSPQGKFHVDHEDAYHMGIQHNKTGTYITETKFGRPSTTSSISIIYDIAGAEIAELRRNYSANTFRITNVSTTHLEISASGVTTIPLQPSFSMYCSGNFTGPGVVPMGGTMYNDGGYYNTSTYRFTAPVAGRYLFSFYDNVMANNSNPSYFGFRVNGGIRGAYAYTSTKTVGNWYLLGFQQIIKLNASDYVDVYNFGADRTDYGSAEWGNFSGHLLG